MSRPNDPQPVPSWATFLSASEFRALIELITRALDRAARVYELDAEQGVVRLLDVEAGEWSLGLLNVMQICHQADREEWPALVEEHISRMVDLAKTKEQSEELERLASDFDEAAGRLKVRLFPEGMEDLEGAVVARRSIPGVLSTLVYDLPETIMTVHPEHAINWARHGDELFRIGLENVRDQDPVSIETIQLDEVTAELLLGNHLFAATHVLMLEDYLTGLEADRGALVVIPHRHAVLAHPIQDETVLAAVNRLHRLAQAMYRDGPGSISASLYWYRQGAFTELPVTGGRHTFQLEPPPEFVHMLNDMFVDGYEPPEGLA